MTQVQSGILLEHCRFAILWKQKYRGVRCHSPRIQKFCQSLQELQQQFPDEHLGAVIAFGSNVWHDLSNGQGAKELKPLFH